MAIRMVRSLAEKTRMDEVMRIRIDEGTEPALRYMKQWQSELGTSMWYYLRLAYLHEEEANYDEAEAALALAAEFGLDERPWIDKAQMRIRQGLWNEALEDLEKANQIADMIGDGLFNQFLYADRAEAWFGAGNYAAARAAWESVITASPVVFTAVGLRNYHEFLTLCADLERKSKRQD